MRSSILLLLIVGVVFLRTANVCAEEKSAEWEWVGWGGGGYYWTCAFHPAKDGTIYLGGDVGGFYKTVDHGENWKVCNEGLTNYGIFSIAVDKKNPDTVYAGTSQGICKSIDAGEHWTLLKATAQGPAAMVFGKQGSVRAIAVDPKDGSTVYAGGVSGTIFLSKDGGETWAKTYALAEKGLIAAITISETEPAVVFAATTAGVIKSEDRGEHWTALPSPKNAANVACAPGSASVLFGAFGKEGVQKSEDGGQTWTSCSQGIPDHCVLREVTVDPKDANKLCCIGNVNWDGYFFASEDGGKTWKANRSIKKDGADNPTLPEDGGGPDAVVPLSATKNIAINPLNSKEIFIAANWRNAYSSDGGKTLEERIQGCEITCITDIRFDKKHVYASAMDEGTYRGDRRGKWEAVWPRKYDGETSGHHWRIGLLSVSDGAAGKLLLTNSPWNLNPQRNQVLICEDGHKPVIAREGLPDYLPRVNCMWGQSYPRGLAVNPKNSEIIYLGMDGDPEPAKKLEGGGIFKSSDGGKTWKRMEQQPACRRIFNALALDSAEASRLYWGACGTGGGVYRSENEGEWKLVFKDETWIFNLEVLHDGTVLAAGKNLWKSSDHGETWQKLTDFDGMQIVGIASGDAKGQTLWVSRVTWGEDAQGGVWESRDGGKTWKEITGSMAYKKPLVLRYDEQEGELWAGGVGVYKRKSE